MCQEFGNIFYFFFFGCYDMKLWGQSDCSYFVLYRSQFEIVVDNRGGEN